MHWPTCSRPRECRWNSTATRRGARCGCGPATGSSAKATAPICGAPRHDETECPAIAIAAGLSLLRLAMAADGDVEFKQEWASLKQYRCPEWFGDAKVGIRAHWDPQGALNR